MIKEKGMEGLIQAVEKLYSLDNRSYNDMIHAARNRVEEHFTIEKMVENYEKIYNKLVEL